MIRKISQQINDIGRLGTIVKVFSKYGFDFLLHQIHIDKKLLGFFPPTGAVSRNATELTFAQRIRKIAEELGPTFIKLAQVLSTRADLVPIEICEELSKLQDKAPNIEFSEIEAILKSEFKKPIQSIFTNIDQNPAGAASLSQVHFATLKSGAEVAIKVQRPDIEKTIQSDLEILKYLAQLAHRYLDDLQPYNLPGIIKQFNKSILKEIDFTIEARNITRFQHCFKDSTTIYIPKHYPSYTTSKVLTVEKINGIKISQVEKLKNKELELEVISKNTTQSLLQQIFEHGVFHADPHPGNIFVLPGNKIAFIDYGLIGRIDEETKGYLADLLTVLIQKDITGVINVLLSLGIISELYDTRELQLDLHEFIDEFHGLSLEDIDVSYLFPKFIEIISKHHLVFPPSFSLLTKSIITIEGVGRLLNPDLNFVEQTKPFVEKLLKDRYSPKAFIKSAKHLGMELFYFARLFPKEARHIFSRLKEGKLKLEFEHRGLETSLHTFSQTINRVAMAIVLASLIIGSSLIVLSGIPPKVYGIPLIGIAGFLGSGFLGAYLLFSILKHGKL